MALAMKALLKEPLVHFLLVGAALFAVFDLAGTKGGEGPGRVVITQGQIASLKADFARTWQRPPTGEELDALVKDRVREEVYCREAIALGLDKDDAVIRRRLRQKLEYVSEDIAAAAEPTDADLRAYYDAHPEAFRGADGSLPDLPDIRDAVIREWTNAKRLEADEAYYQGLLKKYAVVVER